MDQWRTKKIKALKDATRYAVSRVVDFCTRNESHFLSNSGNAEVATHLVLTNRMRGPGCPVYEYIVRYMEKSDEMVPTLDLCDMDGIICNWDVSGLPTYLKRVTA